MFQTFSFAEFWIKRNFRLEVNPIRGEHDFEELELCSEISGK